jgi:hypothetical protein
MASFLWAPQSPEGLAPVWASVLQTISVTGEEVVNTSKAGLQFIESFTDRAPIPTEFFFDV